MASLAGSEIRIRLLEAEVNALKKELERHCGWIDDIQACLNEMAFLVPVEHPGSTKGSPTGAADGKTV